ncbi:MAG: hypothetical protein IKO41_00385 [Lachnospiraceae bacterium]|nr:hypothetical protein [Lachnospiraceae bacterium]
MNDELNQITRAVEGYRFSEACYSVVCFEVTVIAILIGLVTKSLCIGISSLIGIIMLLMLSNKFGKFLSLALTVTLSLCWSWIAYSLGHWLFDSTFEAIGLSILAFIIGLSIHGNGFAVLRCFSGH